MKKSLALAVALTVLLISSASFAQKAAIFNEKGVAVHGYDVVAYFTDSKPVKGDSKFAFNWNNATWYFAGQQHLDLFKASPDKYAPQYGGYCAYGLSENHKAPTIPGAWSIVNGKLYLNYSMGVQTDWKKEQAKRILDADKYWPAIKDKN
jgi:hypothetical protein